MAARRAFTSGLSSAETTAFFLRDLGRSGSRFPEVSALSVSSFITRSGVVGGTGGILWVTMATEFSPDSLRCSVRGAAELRDTFGTIATGSTTSAGCTGKLAGGCALGPTPLGTL